MFRPLLLALMLGVPLTAVAQDPRHDTHVDLKHGNIDLEVHDGTMVSMAPETNLSIDPADNPGEITHIKVHQGQLHVSNVFHRHSDVLHVQVGAHTFELHRGAALISHTPEGIHATLLHGRSLGRRGHPERITKPGFQMRQGPGGFEHTQHPAEQLQRMLNRVGGPGGDRNGPGGQGEEPGEEPGKGIAPGDDLGPGKKPGPPKGLGPRAQGASEFLQQQAFQSLIQDYQGFRPPRPGQGGQGPGNGMPGNGMPGGGMPGNGMPGGGMPGNGMPGNGMPGNGMPGNGMPGGNPRPIP